MSEPKNTGQDDSTLNKPPRKARKTSVADLFARISITQLTLAVLVVIFLWQWLDGHRAISDMQQQLARKIAEMDGTSKANQMLLSQSQDQVRALADKVATLESHYAESQNQRAALEALYNDLSVSRDETALAEVEQMLLIAGQQLQLSANVKAALIAMQSADARLQRMDQPVFNGLRKAIAQDMDKLRALPNADISGINFQLDNLIEAVADLPLVYQQRISETADESPVPAADETAWQKLLREIWQEAKQMVHIEDTGKAEIPLLPPNQEFFLRENLKLRLLTARLALLSRDEESFRHDLNVAQMWADRYFNSKSPAGIRMLSGIKKLAASGINIELPDISPSLQTVRNYRLTRESLPKASLEVQPNSPKVIFEARPTPPKATHETAPNTAKATP